MAASSGVFLHGRRLTTSAVWTCFCFPSLLQQQGICIVFQATATGGKDGGET